jgi:Cohesin domain
MRDFPLLRCFAFRTHRDLAITLGLLAVICWSSGPVLAAALPEEPVLGRQIASGVWEASLVLSQSPGSLAAPGSDPVFSVERAGLNPLKPVSVTGAQEWITLLGDDFESGFPGSWELQYPGTGPYWDDWTCWSNSLSHSVGCAAGGTGAITCAGSYPASMDSRMIAGPGSLADPGIVSGVLECFLNLNSEPSNDSFYIMVSIDNSTFHGYGYSGPVLQTVSLDLAAVPVLGSILGESQVWIAFIFQSNATVSALNGAQIDDVVLAVDMATNLAPVVTVTAPNGGETLSAGAMAAVTYSATDSDADDSALAMSFDYSTNSGSSWTAIASGQLNTGTYNWTIPNLASSSVRVRVRAYDGVDESNDTSNANFSIVQNENVLTLGDASGPSGTSVTVALDLANQDAVKGIQADITFDGTKAYFSGIAASARATGMVVQGEQISENLARIILYYDSVTQLAIGSGEVAEVTFTLQGPGGGSTELALGDMVLSGVSGGSLPVTGTDGQLTVENPEAIPNLQITALKNPGRARTMQILVRIANGSGAAPTVNAGGSSVSMTALGQAVYLGSYSATQTATSVTISASDTNVLGLGTAQTTVSFQ